MPVFCSNGNRYLNATALWTWTETIPVRRRTNSPNLSNWRIITAIVASMKDSSASPNGFRIQRLQDIPVEVLIILLLLKAPRHPRGKTINHKHLHLSRHFCQELHWTFIFIGNYFMRLFYLVLAGRLKVSFPSQDQIRFKRLQCPQIPCGTFVGTLEIRKHCCRIRGHPQDIRFGIR